MENIAKSTSYGCYLDCDFETAKYPDDKTHIVGLLAEYVYDLEQRILHYDERYIKLWNEIETLRECVSKEFDQEQKIADLEAKLAEKEKENKTLKDIRTLERVVPRNAQLNKLSNRDCYLKGFENAISETIRTFEETYGKEKCKLIEERDKYLMDIVKVGGYEYQIEELKQQLEEKEKEKEKEKEYQSFKKIADENVNYLKNRILEETKNYNQDKISFAIEQLEKVKEEMDLRPRGVSKGWKNKEYDTLVEEDVYEVIDNQIKQLKEGK